MFIDTAFNPTGRAPDERKVSGGPGEPVGKITECLSLCILSGLRVSVVNGSVGQSTTETQSSPRSHRESEVNPTDSGGADTSLAGIRVAPSALKLLGLHEARAHARGY
jgi:hypothetical protein